MNRVVFHIGELGAIRDSEFAMAPLMIFSGESGLGKSYAAFLAHYIYEILLSDRIKHFFDDKGYDFKKIFKEKQSGKSILSIQTKDLVDWLNNDAVAYVSYLIGNPGLTGRVSIELPLHEQTFEFVYNEEMRGLNDQEDVYYTIGLKTFTYSVVAANFLEDSTAFSELIKAVLREEVFGNFRSLTNTYLLPPSRGSLMEIDQKPSFISGMYDEFWLMKQDIARSLPRPNAIDENIINYSRLVNKGRVERVGGKLMYFTNDAVMPLTAAASSIKELSPLTLFLSKYPVRGVSFLFEEPEAHLHPIRQSHLADLIGCMINDGAFLQITTHSDYFLKRLNNLIKLFLLKDKVEEGKFDDFLKQWDIEKAILLDPNNIVSLFVKETSDGHSMIVTQNIHEDNEIPFESFYDSIEDDLKLSQEINQLENSL